MTTKPVSKEQEEEFKRRLANRQPSNEARIVPRFSSKQFKAFIKATDEKCE